MSGDTSSSVMGLETLSLEDGPPEYSATKEPPSNLMKPLASTGLSNSTGFEELKTRPTIHAYKYAKLFSKCTRCAAPMGVSEYHYGCLKCTQVVVCICQKCWSNCPTCRIHKRDLVKRTLKTWLALPPWVNYISPTPTTTDNPLIHALKTRNDVLTTLHASDPFLLNARTYLGHTPLHFAALLGLVSGASILLSHGALTNSRCDYNFTPLMVAVDHKQLQMVDLLLQHNANIHSVGGFSESTALHIAAANRSPELVSLFLEKGAIIDTPSKRGTALQLAARIDSFDCASILLEKGANPNAKSTHEFGEPPLILAARNDNADLVDLLIKYGADVDLSFTIKNTEVTAFFVAMACGFPSMVRRLQGYGANIHLRQMRGITCLMSAAAIGQVEMCEVLIDIGVEIDAESDIGINAILSAAITGKEDVVKVLLEKGANGKPPRACAGTWKRLENFFKEEVSKETRTRILELLEKGTTRKPPKVCAGKWKKLKEVFKKK